MPTSSFRKTMTVAEQALYTGISGNLHPLYVNAVHARAASGGERLVFELAVAALATTALAEIGGPTRRIAALNLAFPVPVRIGDTVEAQAETEGDANEPMRVRVTCLRHDGTVVATGHADLAEVAGA